jgi:hypothetical protein
VEDMPTNRKDKMVLSGMAVLSVGVALLIFTFIIAYWFLVQSPATATSSTMQTFGDVLALVGLQKTRLVPITLSDLTFEIKQGRLYYDNFVINTAELLAIK